MRKIEFIAPVAAMRGNMSVTQKNIVYPTHDNRAYEGPDGERNTARNYQPILIGAKRRLNGKTYFCVKTKTTNHLTPLAKSAMASMGAACSIYAAMLKDPQIAAKMDLVMAELWEKFPERTKKSFFMERISGALKAKQAVIYGTYGNVILTVNNPFVSDGTGTYNVTLKSDILAKFWVELANDPLTFHVNGNLGVAHSGDTFGDVINSHYNTLGLYGSDKDGSIYIKCLESYLIAWDPNDPIEPEYIEYMTTENGVMGENEYLNYALTNIEP